MNLDAAAVDDLLARVRQDVESGLLPAAQLALGCEGEIVVSEAFGHCTTDSRFHMYSAVKPAVALTALELAAEGAFDVEAPVSEVLDGFGANGKDGITVSQVLVHAGGFPHAPLHVEAWADRPARLESYRRWHTTWAPGTRFEYHATSAHWVLADMIAEVTGRHHRDVIAERLLEPAGCRNWLDPDPPGPSGVVDVVPVGSEPDLAELARALGVDELPETEVTMEALTAFNHPALRAAANPGGGGMASAADLARWYQAVLHNSGGLLRPEVREEAVTVRQNRPDWLGVPVNRSRAFVLAGDDGRANFRGFGHKASPGAFGHGGAKGQIGWADPATGASFAYFTNGLDRDDLALGRRSVGISTRAEACLRPR